MELGEDVVQILATSKTIAVVRLSDKPDRLSYQIAAYLQQHGYRIIPVNPTITGALGETAYPSLRDIPERVDAVQVFRKPDDVPPVVEDAIAIGAKVVWMQPGIVNEEAAARAKAAGLKVLVDICMRATHRTFMREGRSHEREHSAKGTSDPASDSYGRLGR